QMSSMNIDYAFYCTDGKFNMGNAEAAECAKLVNAHKNIFCDTACIQKKNLEKLRSLVRDKEKILFGSDFPVTHYFSTHYFKKEYSLKEEYLLDCKIMP
ncbi:MAG: hypothetical protein J5817_10700, partial [Treponema sp.]|nr:hypothetical protein [Treponema sp.]